jgi:hypothetical protein
LESQKSLSVSVSDSVNVNGSVSKVNNIYRRKLKFASTLEPYLVTYGKELLNDFYKYWTEPNKSNTKFRQELEKTWSLERRLETWSKNDFKNKEKSSAQKESKIENLAKVSDELDVILGINTNNQIK